MSQYHVTAAGKSAVCKAQPGNCPLGGKHFETKDKADFYIEVRSALGVAESAAVARPAGSVDLELAKLSPEELNKRLKALSKLEIAERFGEEKDVDAAAAKLEEMGEDVNDPTWNQQNLQRELIKRNPQWAKPAVAA